MFISNCGLLASYPAPAPNPLPFQPQICHRDIKLENILLADEQTAKVIDFGLCSQGPLQRRLHVHCGSPSYAAPEIVARQHYIGPPVDVWSLGVVLYAMVAGHLPFHSRQGNKQELCSKIMRGQYTMPDHISEELQALLKCMLTVEPANRIALGEVWCQPWVQQGVPWDKRTRCVYVVEHDGYGTGDLGYWEGGCARGKGGPWKLISTVVALFRS